MTTVLKWTMIIFFSVLVTLDVIVIGSFIFTRELVTAMLILVPSLLVMTLVYHYIGGEL